MSDKLWCLRMTVLKEYYVKAETIEDAVKKVRDKKHLIGWQLDAGNMIEEVIE